MRSQGPSATVKKKKASTSKQPALTKKKATANKQMLIFTLFLLI
jgi:hypothetical protein